MAKFQEVYEETKEVFNTHINNSGIPGFVNIKILSNESLKDCFGQVTKSQDIVKFMTDYDVIIQINEPIFDQLESDQKDYVVKDLLAQIVYNLDSDKLSINKPDITTFSGVLRQYSIDDYIGICESIKTLQEQKKIQEDAAKQAAKKTKVTA
tara:strand:- start:467 stop:922 length:456 start_codon:yes stop_codon:yes gene_type:complete